MGERPVIRDVALWQAWEDEFVLRRTVDFERNLNLVDSMLEHARIVGAFPLPDPLVGLDVKIRLARVVNVPTTSGTDCPGT